VELLADCLWRAETTLQLESTFSMAKSSESLSCECGQVLFDVAGREPGETLTCPWCNKEYRYLGGRRVEPVSKGKSARLKQSPDDEAKLKAAKPKSVREDQSENSAKESAKKIKVEGNEEVFTFNSADQETVKMKAMSARRKPARDGDSADPDAPPPPPRKKGGGLGDAPGGVMPMLGFMVGFSAIAFVVLATVFPENIHHKRTTPWGEMLALRSPWPELIAMILGQFFGFVAWGFYAYRLHLRQKAAAEAAALSGEGKPSEKSAGISNKKISVRRKSVREKKRSRDEDDDTGGNDDDDSERDSER
jgi:hypothetical protein